MIREYRKNRYIHKNQVGKDNHQGFKFTDDEMKEEVSSVIDKYIEEYKTLPPTKLIGNFLKYNESQYRNRFNMNWFEIYEMLGYQVEKESNKSEKLVLSIVSKLIGENYIPQAKFNWLKSEKGYPLMCDGYFPEHKLIIEFDGKQHYEPIEQFGGEEGFERTLRNDKVKNELIPANGLKLVRISCYDQYWSEDVIKYILNKHGIKTKHQYAPT